MKLENNTILITGGTSGFGSGLAAKLLALGNTVIITGRDQAKLDLAKKQLPGIHIFQSDVSKPAEIESLYQKVSGQFPALNMLINNAGEMRAIILQDATHDITREIEINLMGPIRMIQQFLPQLKKVKSAAIINVTSGLALTPFPISPIYGATKSGLRSYTQSLRVQLKNTSIKVVEILPPAVNTPLNDKFLTMDGFDPKTMMDLDKAVDAAIKGLQTDKNEILLGFAVIIKFLSRLAPGVLLSQTGKVGAKAMYGIK